MKITQVISSLKKSIMLLTVVCFTFIAKGQQPNQQINISPANTTVKHLIEQIEKQTGYSFVYSNRFADVNKQITIQRTNTTIKELFLQISALTNLKFTAVGNQVVVKEKEIGRVTGNVATTDGQASGAVNISIKGAGSTQTDEDGNFTLNNVEAGNQTLIASYIGMGTKSKNIVVIAGQTIKANFVLTAQNNALNEIRVTGQKRKTSSVTKSEVPLENLPMMVQIIDQSILQQRQITSIKDAISSASGITYTSSFIGGYDSFTGRGFDLTMMRNGVSVENGAGQLYGDNIESIDILKGPASIQYGDIAPGSVMNLVSKKPLDYDYKRFEMKIGQYGLFRPTFDISGPLNVQKTVLFRLNTSLEKSNSFRDEINSRVFFLAPTLTWKITPKLTWNIEGIFNDDVRTADPGVISPDNSFEGLKKVRFATFLGEPANEYRSNEESVFSNLEYQLSKDWKIRNSSYYTNAKRRYGWMSLDASSITPNGDLERGYSMENGDHGGWGTTFDILGKVKTGSIIHNIIVGAEMLQNDRSRSLSPWVTLEKPINLYRPVYGQSTLILDNLGKPANPATERKRFGAYAQDQFSFLDDRVHVLMGLRYNHVKRSASWSDGAPAAYKPDVQDVFNPRLGLLFKPAKWMSVYGSYTNSFEMNGQNQLTGELVAPTNSHQFEAGIKTSLLNNQLGITFAAFKIDKKNVTGIVTDLTEAPDFPYTDYNPTSGIASYIGARHQSKGLELDINGKINAELTLNIAASYIDAIIVDDPAYPKGNELAGNSKAIVNIWANYAFSTLPLKGLELGAGYSYRGQNYATSYNLPEQLAPGFATFDASAAYSFNHFFTRLNVTNLTNRKAYTYGMYGGYYPLWSQRAVLSLGVRF
ncbi:hypothetical protein DBR43_29255 [Pedobacter sp. KBW06]|uniref:TonB-dependent siderophore receptor n=1 Tax=Pedobacter sp. KBW06 TaxID=2153359 RepID=UPI000F59E276|nr:TonB-dependent siderophore receptor [Pedobacter sp. KBW06]RQO66315.1 hypothetical protein DBR43_29255 [Pedobacter sp. KBW06]